jgi:catechol 2,3-dioxygenase-like lactoylglutathione lyase family enzyme
MAAMTVTHLFAGIPVSDYEAAVAWYERLLGRPPDVRPHETEVMWHVREGASIYVVVDAERAGNALVTLAVDDLGSLPTEPGPGGMTMSVVSDPDGNQVKLFVDPSA